LAMSSCCGPWRFRHGHQEADDDPLLGAEDDDTPRQRQLRRKLHSYQMIRALAHGYLPSTEQTVAQLRAVLASDVLNPHDDELSNSGRQLARDIKLTIRAFMDLLREKIPDDELQEFLWHFSKARASLDTSELVSQASAVKAQADTKAGKHIPSLIRVGRSSHMGSGHHCYLVFVRSLIRCLIWYRCSAMFWHAG
jgi:hypothetical protein